jgi:YfiH family protein
VATWLKHSKAIDWRHGWTDKAGPDFLSAPTSDEHRLAVQKLVDVVGLRAGAWVHQVHGGTVLRATEPGYIGEADALWTTEPGLGVVGRSADCPLILISGNDASGMAYRAFAHASWRSTVAQITHNVMKEMIKAGMLVERAQALICPSAGPCCYEVGPEVQEAALKELGTNSAAHFVPYGDGIAYDLWAANRAQLEAAGMASRDIFVTGVCTICSGHEYPSHRREKGLAGRMAAICGA